jgi:hypothetical protein
MIHLFTRLDSTDELSKIQKETKSLVISCLTGIVANLIKTALEKAMLSVGAIMSEAIQV